MPKEKSDILLFLVVNFFQIVYMIINHVIMLVVVTNMIKVKIKKKGDSMSISKIRFKGYDNSIERKTIGDITTSFSGGTPKSSNKTYYEGNIPFIRSGEIKSKQTELFISDEALKNSSAKMVEKGDILYALYGATSGEVAICQINGAINQAILAIKPNSGYSSEFIMNYLKKEKDNILEKYLQGGQGNLSAAIVKSIELHLPSQKEQSAIGSLFRTLDDLLASYKDNLANYQSFKSTMLSKMFPKAGQTVPEIRLDGFEGEWKTKILSEVTNITMGQSPKSENYTDNPNDYILVQGNADIKDNQVVPRLWTTEVTKMAEIGDIILTVRAPVGDIGKTDYNVVIGRGVAAIKGNDFIFYTLEKMKMTGFWNRFSTGSTFESISSNDIKEAIIQIPTLKEQQAIGAYFSNLDQLISSYQDKITQLETLKKKLLQDMFI